MSAPKDWKEFLLCLNSRGVEYVIVGGWRWPTTHVPDLQGISIFSTASPGKTQSEYYRR